MRMPDLSRPLVLEQPVQVADGAGGYTRDWQELGVLWAEVTSGAGREAAAFAVTVSRVPYRIVVRASKPGAPSRPVPGQRFRDGTRVFNINAVADRGTDGRYLICRTEEEVAS
ncbi:head-tail adaptor protein [Yoonia sp. BS5-3]|uniref:Head-tail adaptor protein n=1 Tax=Yoonia phaeophyticola TaxID=3137369 RepID=A0ABZ2V251_9RHOB